MAVIHNLDQHYIDTQLICPPGKARIEFVDPQATGLYIEVRAKSPGQGTYYLRYKRSKKSLHERIGRTSELTLEEARAAAARFKASVGNALPAQPAQVPQTALPLPATGQVQPQVGMTLDTFWKDHYLPHANAHKRSAWRDEQIYRRLKPKFGDLPMNAIARLAVQQFQNALLAEGKLAKSTINQHVVLLRRMLNLAVSWEMLDRNVLTRIPLFHLDNQVEHFLDEQQVAKLVEVLKTDENRIVCQILFFLLNTGARRSEGLKAEWKDVNLEKRTWRIPATNSKSKKMKTLPLNPGAISVIEQLTSKDTSPYLFPSPATGKPFLEITRVWYRLRRKAGLPSNIRIHDLRHTFASTLVSKGRSLFEVQQLLGHADPRMSMRYAHLSMKAMQEASNAASLSFA